MRSAELVELAVDRITLIEGQATFLDYIERTALGRDPEDARMTDSLADHLPGVANPDPIFASHELSRLLGLVQRATLTR